MRRQSLVASAVLTAAFVTLVALPGVAGSETPSTVRPLTAGAFQGVRFTASEDGSPEAIRPLDAEYESAGHLDDTAPLIEEGDNAPPIGRSTVVVPVPVLELLTASASPAPTATAAATPSPTGSVKAATSKPVSASTVKVAIGRAPTYRRVMTGLASWYDNGTTAMRLPHGTHIRICGAKTCISTVVRDWGPATYLSKRVVDMTPQDFVRVTGRHLGAGLAPVTVYIY